MEEGEPPHTENFPLLKPGPNMLLCVGEASSHSGDGDPVGES
jgi:hypothetical protein